MTVISSKSAWLALGLSSAGLVGGSFLLTAGYDLQPCYLCIFQRLLFMLLAAVCLVAAVTTSDRLGRAVGALGLPIALLGAGTAAYQSWLQRQPVDTVSCLGGEPGLIERLVEWLGQLLPGLFLATGFCEDDGLVILGLTLANWSLLAFLAALIVMTQALLLASATESR